MSIVPAHIYKHPLCAGPGCSSCTRIENELNERRAETRDRLDRLDTDWIVRAMHWLAWEKPDVVRDALDAEGAPA